MATLTIRNVPEDVKRDLRRAAAERGVSMEQEARDRLGGEGKRPAKLTAEEIVRKVARKPEEQIDLKKLTDEMWDEGLL